MRRLVLITAAIAAAIAGAFAAEPSFGTLTDARDGQKYRTVVIGGKKWTAQNLNYKTDSSWCYENSTDSCNKYGRLYAWNAAIKACPAGYHLPSRKEWNSLGQAVGGKREPQAYGDICWGGAGKKLKAKNGWSWNNDRNISGNGTDDFGFSAMSGGYRYSSGEFTNVGYNGFWWTATENEDGSVYGRNMFWKLDAMCEGYDGKKSGYSVRCVADAP
jgi:uncharacterized protein (TIGR02145 family)